MDSIARLLDTLPDETGVLPGHMNPTTLGTERASNPFLRELAHR
jgi:glyoxylase-like metal-dependent hydrolase (beta-lactamase superfamily II)